MGTTALNTGDAFERVKEGTANNILDLCLDRFSCY